MNKKIFSIILLIIFSFNVLAIDYFKTTGDSIFVAGVDWQKQEEDNYVAYVTVDLAYDQFANPLNRYAIVEQYYWTNWWASFINFGSIGEINPLLDENGNVQEFIQLDFYTELPDLVNTGDIDDYDCTNLGGCSESVPSIKVGYYGLPFYIKYLEFICDVDNPSKGGLILQPELTDQDTFSLIRYNYDGIPNTNVTVETSITPLGWISNPGDIVRYSGIPVFCEGMTDTTNSKLNFILKPNPIYRNVDPNTIDSDTWNFNELISIFPPISNKNELPFNLDIGFNFSGASVDYTLNNEEIEAYYNNLFGEPNQYNLDCTIITIFGNTKTIKYSELTNEQKLIINTGEDITCVYPDDVGVTNLNNRLANNILESIAVQKQREILLQYNQLEKKLATKKFVSSSIIPFFGALTILIFYFIQLLILGVAFLGIIPLMFVEFIKGIKESMSIEDIIKPVNKKKGGKK